MGFTKTGKSIGTLRREAKAEERARLRPLLERCLDKLNAAALTLEASQITAIRFDDLLADLRRELGLKGKE